MTAYTSTSSFNIYLHSALCIGILWLRTSHAHDRHQSSSSSDSAGAYNQHDHAMLYMNNSNGCMGIYRQPCVCTPNEVVCVNAQYTDSDLYSRPVLVIVYILSERGTHTQSQFLCHIPNRRAPPRFLTVATHFPYLERATYRGNNFRNMPARIFGPNVQMNHLRMLNVSSNYIIQLHADALKGVPNLETLDMSDNEINLNGNESAFFTHTPRLRRLIWRQALNRNINQTRQLQRLMRMLYTAKLDNLETIDLGLNNLPSVDAELACHLPALRTFNLNANRMRTLRLNTTCLQHLDTLDIRYNDITEFDIQFRRTASLLPDYSLLVENRFVCDCQAHASISWFRATNKIQDRDRLRCHRASPRTLDNALLLDVPLDQLDCATNLTTNAAASPAEQRTYLIVVTLFVAHSVRHECYY